MSGVLALLVWLPALTVQATPQTPPPQAPALGNVYLALGDSIAAGVGASLPDERGYPAIVAGYLNRLADHRVELENLAAPGETTTSFIHIGQLAKALQTIASAKAAGQRVGPITLTLGANDLLDAPTGTASRERALQTVAANLRDILARLRAPTTELVVTTYYDPSGSDPNRPHSDGWWLARLNEVIRQETTRAGGRIADISALFAGHTRDWTWYPGDIHPNNAGYQAIADAVWQTLRLDRTPPSVRFTRPAPGRLDRAIPTVAVDATDRVGVTRVFLTIDGQPGLDLPYLPDLGAYAALLDTRTLPPGPHILQALATDAAGNVGSAKLTVVVTATSRASPSAPSDGTETPLPGS